MKAIAVIFFVVVGAFVIGLAMLGLAVIATLLREAIQENNNQKSK